MVRKILTSLLGAVVVGRAHGIGNHRNEAAISLFLAVGDEQLLVFRGAFKLIGQSGHLLSKNALNQTTVLKKKTATLHSSMELVNMRLESCSEIIQNCRQLDVEACIPTVSHAILERLQKFYAHD